MYRKERCVESDNSNYLKTYFKSYNDKKKRMEGLVDRADLSKYFYITSAVMNRLYCTAWCTSH